MGGDQLLVHVARMAGRIADAGDARHLGNAPHQARQRPDPAIGAIAMIGVDVLAEQRDVLHAGLRQPLDFGDHLRDRAREFGAAGIGHDAEGAELVAAFLHGDEGRNAAGEDRRRLRRRQMAELVLGRQFRIDDAAALRLRQQFRQAVIGLRADDEVDGRLAPLDLGAFGLRDAAGDDELGLASLRFALALQVAQLAELGIDLVRRPLADMAGIQQDEIGVVGRRSLDITLLAQDVGHALAVIDVHLAAIGLDVDFLHQR